MFDSQIIKQNTPESVTIIVVGDVRVGKTTLIRKTCSIPIAGKVVPTIGVQFAATSLQLNSRVFRVKFWDISGQKKYEYLFKNYIQKANIAIVVFDLTNYESFHNAKEWVMEIKQKYEQVSILMFGNKKDIFDKNPKSTIFVPKHSIEKFTKQFNIVYEEGCALSDSKFAEGIKKILRAQFVPNDIILQGASQVKTCKCFC